MPTYITVPIPAKASDLPDLPVAKLIDQVQMVHRVLYHDPKYHALVGFLGPMQEAKYKLFQASHTILEYAKSKNIQPLAGIDYSEEFRVFKALSAALRRDGIAANQRKG